MSHHPHQTTKGGGTTLSAPGYASFLGRARISYAARDRNMGMRGCMPYSGNFSRRAALESNTREDHEAGCTRRTLLLMSTSLCLMASPVRAADVIDGQGDVKVLGLDAEEDLTVSQRQLLEYNKRAQRQNSAPPDFPLFIREGYDMTLLTSEGYQVTPEGLIYKDYAVGAGDEYPKDGQQVTFDYTAYNESASVIDSSYRKGQPASTRLGISGMIPGFELGIKTMKPGGKRRIVVPPELGPPVGPSTFFSAKQFEVFDVELRSAKTCTRRTIGMFSDVVCE